MGQAFSGRAVLDGARILREKSQKREDLQQNCPNIYLVLPEYWKF